MIQTMRKPAASVSGVGERKGSILSGYGRQFGPSSSVPERGNRIQRLAVICMEGRKIWRFHSSGRTSGRPRHSVQSF
jgi:hypothetical protein